jgi:hypothetical protein
MLEELWSIKKIYHFLEPASTLNCPSATVEPHNLIVYLMRRINCLGESHDGKFYLTISD